MSRDREFLDAVIDDPDDDAPRLAYADWLAGRGDPRGEFIRVQVELACLSGDGPRREALARREQELLDEHAREWAEPLRPFITEWTYRRGFIERVGASLEVPAARIVEMLRLAPIRHIRDAGQFCELEGVVEALPHLRHLTGLEFWALYAFDDEMLGQLLQSPHLAGLRTLILHHDRNGNLLDDDVLIRWLAPPPDFQGYFPGMTPPSRRATLRELAVNVDGTWRGPSPAVVRAMARSPLLGRLRKLSLSHAYLDLETVEELARSPHLVHLEELDLASCNLMGEVWDAILRLPQMGRLKWLRLRGAEQTDSPGECMEELIRIPRYQEAFERGAARVDWETEHIAPWAGGCWEGFTWEERRGPSQPIANADAGMSAAAVPISEDAGNPEVLGLLARDIGSYSDAESFLADLEALERAAGAGLPMTSRLVEAAIEAADGYKRMARISVNERTREDVVAERILPAFGPAIIPGLLKGYDPTNSRVAAGRLAAICRIDPGLGRRLCFEAIPAADRHLQEVILEGLGLVAPAEVEQVALGMLEKGFGKLGPFHERGGHVARALKRLGLLSEPAFGRVMNALGHPNPQVRDAAADVLGGLGPRARAAVPALHAMLRDPEAQSYSALEALKSIDPKGEEDVAELVAGLGDESYFYRFAMVRWLRSLGPRAHAAVPALIASLGDEHHFVSSEAIDAIGDVGPAARSAIPALAAILGGEGHQHGHLAARALARIGEVDDDAFDALIAALRMPDPGVRRRAIEALEECGAKFDRAIPHLAAMIDGPEDQARSCALSTLLKRTIPETYAVIACRAGLNHEKPFFRRAAAQAFALLSPEAQAEVKGRHQRPSA